MTHYLQKFKRWQRRLRAWSVHTRISTTLGDVIVNVDGMVITIPAGGCCKRQDIRICISYIIVVDEYH